MRIIGRKTEKRELERLCASPRPEFLVVYGRRRIGKTFLVREYFNHAFAFYATGIAKGSMRAQLHAFSLALAEYGGPLAKRPEDWFEAFELLKGILRRNDITRDSMSGKKVVFIDEMPWLDTPRSQFKQALDLFWNSYGSQDPDLLLIACGSATSWVIRNLLRDHGGLHNRVTSRIHLQPFTLAECEAYYRGYDIAFTRLQMLECYMVFGGVPFYLDLLDRRLSLAQNIDRLCFSESGALRYEFDELYRSLFKQAGSHIAIIKFLAAKRGGATRQTIEAKAGIPSGGTLTKVLEELEQCGFVRRYRHPTKRLRGALYQVIDPFTLFWLRFVASEKLAGEGAWLSAMGGPAYRAWIGLAFETVCLMHTPQIKHALGVSGIACEAYAWRSEKSDPGAQIDVVLDRADGVVNLCECKFADVPFVVDKAYEQVLRNKIAAYRDEVESRKALHLTMIAPFGVSANAYAQVAQNVITADDLFSI